MKHETGSYTVPFFIGKNRYSVYAISVYLDTLMVLFLGGFVARVCQDIVMVVYTGNGM